MSDQDYAWSTTVPCQDAHGRPREATVYVRHDGSLGVLAPPGEAIHFTARSAGINFRDAIAAALHQAGQVADKRRQK